MYDVVQAVKNEVGHVDVSINEDGDTLTIKELGGPYTLYITRYLGNKWHFLPETHAPTKISHLELRKKVHYVLNPLPESISR